MRGGGGSHNCFTKLSDNTDLRFANSFLHINAWKGNSVSEIIVSVIFGATIDLILNLYSWITKKKSVRNMLFNKKNSNIITGTNSTLEILYIGNPEYTNTFLVNNMHFINKILKPNSDKNNKMYKRIFNYYTLFGWKMLRDDHKIVGFVHDEIHDVDMDIILKNLKLMLSTNKPTTDITDYVVNGMDKFYDGNKDKFIKWLQC